MRPIVRINPLQTLQPLIHSEATYQAQLTRALRQSSRLSHNPSSFVRPQLPFLYNTRHRISGIHVRFSGFLSQEKWKSRRQLLWRAIKITSLLLLAEACYFTLLLGLEHREIERQFPEPPEYSIWTKWLWRQAYMYSSPSDSSVIVKWLWVGDKWKAIIARLEHPEIDGAGVRQKLHDGEAAPVPNLENVGLNITAKSETWRRGYHTALMAAAKAAERLDGWLKDVKRQLAFPAEVVPGPSNPRPRPTLFFSPEASKEEDCEVAFEDPQTFYLKVLTTEGFTSRQRLDAALACGDYLQYKRRFSSSADMYEWAIDIAMANAPKDIIDRKTGIIRKDVTNISENVLLAASAMAMHKAQTGDLPRALPIYLSVLRAQRLLPPADPRTFANSKPVKQAATTWYGKIEDFFEQPSYPEAPPSGDEPATQTPIASCNEAATMAHIGEILYASSYAPPSGTGASAVMKSKENGLSWTRDAVDLAEATIKSMSRTQPSEGEQPGQTRNLGSTAEKEAKERCVECLAMAVDNWKKMLEPLRQAESAEQEKAKAEAATRKSNQRSWNPLSKQHVEEDMGRWEKEERIVAAREIELTSLLRMEGLRMAELSS